MRIVSGSLYVDATEREAYLAGCHEVTAARATDGCIDFHIAADPIEPRRINVYEQWDSVAAVEAFRWSGPPMTRARRSGTPLCSSTRSHQPSASSYQGLGGLRLR